MNQAAQPENRKGGDAEPRRCELFLDLRQDARRGAIQSQLRQAMDETQISAFKDMRDKLRFEREHYANLGEITEAIARLELPEGVKSSLGAVYGILAEAEASVHDAPVSEVHFHEVGSASGLRNAAEIALAFFILDPEQVVATPVQVGSGQIEAAHGIMDVPAPATRAILDRGIPLSQTRLSGELCTPTSAALICHFVDRFVEDED